MTENVNYITKKAFITLDSFNCSFVSAEKFQQWFTEKELIEYKLPKRANSLAGRYLVKKTILDFLGTDLPGNQMEILNNELGKPIISYNSQLFGIINDKNIEEIHFSISHSKVYVAALVIFSPK